MIAPAELSFEEGKGDRLRWMRCGRAERPDEVRFRPAVIPSSCAAEAPAAARNLLRLRSFPHPLRLLQTVGIFLCCHTKEILPAGILRLAICNQSAPALRMTARCLLFQCLLAANETRRNDGGDSSRWRSTLCGDSPGRASAQNDSGTFIVPVSVGLMRFFFQPAFACH